MFGARDVELQMPRIWFMYWAGVHISIVTYQNRLFFEVELDVDEVTWEISTDLERFVFHVVVQKMVSGRVTLSGSLVKRYDLKQDFSERCDIPCSGTIDELDFELTVSDMRFSGCLDDEWNTIEGEVDGETFSGRHIEREEIMGMFKKMTIRE